MDIYLVRHTPVSVLSNTCYGQLDLEVDSNFSEHCLRLFPLFQKLKKSAVYASPLRRCTLMAQYFYNEFSLIEDLREINFGDWEGKPWDEIPRIEVDQWANNVCDFSPSNGESLRELNYRVLRFLKDIEAKDKERESVVVFTHAGPIRSILAHYLKLDLASTLKIAVDYSSVSKIILDKEFTRVAFLNRVSSAAHEWA